MVTYMSQFAMVCSYNWYPAEQVYKLLNNELGVLFKYTKL